MIERVYTRADSPPQSPHFATCYNGLNADEVLDLLNVSGDHSWIQLPTVDTGLRIIDTLGSEPLTVLDFAIGDWATPVGAVKYVDDDFVSTFSLADAALAP